MSKRTLTREDFTKDIPDALIEFLNGLNDETDEYEHKAMFCRQHGFEREYQWQRREVDVRVGIYVEICNKFGKFF